MIDDETLPPNEDEAAMLAVLEHLQTSGTYRATAGDRDCAGDWV